VLVAAFGVLGIVGIAWTWIPLAALAAAWAGVLTVIAVRAPTYRFRTAIVAATMHAAYGVGVWWGLATGRPKVQTLGMSEPHGSDASA